MFQSVQLLRTNVSLSSSNQCDLSIFDKIKSFHISLKNYDAPFDIKFIQTVQQIQHLMNEKQQKTLEFQINLNSNQIKLKCLPCVSVLNMSNLTMR